MGKRFKGSHATVVVAVGNDKHADLLVKTAASLCRRTGMKMRLVQVAEYWVGRTWPRELTMEGPLGETIQAVEEESVRAAQDRLRKIAATDASGVEVEINVLFGWPAECVVADAVANRAALIIAGASKGSHRFVPKGLSTALSLMAESPVPVLVIQEGSSVSFDREVMHVLFADDLSESSEPAALGAFDLAMGMGRCHLHHLHVNGLTEQNLRISLETAAAASRGDLRGLSVSDIYATAVRTLEDKLKARAPGRKHLLEAAGGAYTAEIRTGEVLEELQKAAEKVNADLLVFGRHRTFRRKPFIIGQLPFYAMLTPHRPVLVVPAE